VQGGGGVKQNTVAASAAARALTDAGVGRCFVGLFPTSLSPTRAAQGGDPYHGGLERRGRPEGSEWFAPTFIDDATLLQGSSGGDESTRWQEFEAVWLDFFHEISTQAHPYILVSLSYRAQQGHIPDSIFSPVLIQSFG
jgi:hypothetical protein